MSTMRTVLSIFVMIFFVQIRSVQTVVCYQCVDCTDPFNAQASGVTLSAASCPYCYKLTAWVAYAPARYVIKDCVQTCNETGSIFGGASIEVNCCTSSLCNGAVPKVSSSQRILFIVASCCAWFALKQ